MAAKAGIQLSPEDVAQIQAMGEKSGASQQIPQEEPQPQGQTNIPPEIQQALAEYPEPIQRLLLQMEPDKMMVLLQNPDELIGVLQKMVGGEQ
jgi:hypothetical protein